jgi:hypothetical protein
VHVHAYTLLSLQALSAEARGAKARLAELRRWQTQVEGYFGSKVSQLNDHMRDFASFTDEVKQRQKENVDYNAHVPRT